MAYDSQRARTVLFGGWDGSYRSDTWEWDGTAWLQVSSSGPSARYFGALVFDSQRGRAVLFGGQDSSTVGLVGDTWEWNGASWTPVVGGGPPPRFGHAMAFDSQRGRVVLFGGGDGTAFGDTWEWDGTTWSLRSNAGPAGRLWHAMAYDSQRGRTVLFGGNQPGVGLLGDTWEWDGAACLPMASVGPAARNSYCMAYDSQRGRTVLFAGGTSGGASRDTWEWNGSLWTQMASSGPAARADHAMVYDSQRGRTVLFGGADNNTLFGDTWEWWDPNPAMASASSFGSGCGTPPLALSPNVSAPPAIGTTAQALLSDVPSPLAFMAIGWSRTTAGPFLLPVPLDAYGMTTCFMRQSTEVLGLATTSTGPGTATYALPLPNQSNLIGAHVYLQAYAVAPGMNPANIIVSNGLDWQIGY